MPLSIRTPSTYMIKSPFLIIKNFMSPMECETLLASVDTSIPNYDINDKSLKTIIKMPIFRSRTWQRLQNYFDDIEDYYNVEIDAIAPVDVEWYPENCIDSGQRCENSIYNGKKWTIYNDHDFTVVVFLKDYNNNSDFDEDFECYGGKLHMLNHDFSFTPIRGTAVIFPSNQYFINATESPKYGDAFQLRTHIVCTERFKYDRNRYQGSHGVWFRGLT